MKMSRDISRDWASGHEAEDLRALLYQCNSHTPLSWDESESYFFTYLTLNNIKYDYMIK